MKIIFSIKSGLSRSAKAWKGIIILWFISLFIVLLLVVPLNTSIKAALGNSMITEKLMDGINIDVLGDLGTNLHSLISSLFSGILLLSLAGTFLNIFITGGLFHSLRSNSIRFSPGDFFRASSKNFWPFMIISILLYLLVIFLFVFIIVVPASIAGKAEFPSEGAVLRTIVVSGSIFLLLLSIIFLVADYARAWQTSRPHNSSFKALGFGFTQTFRTFFSSFPLMIIMLMLQCLLGWGVIKIMAVYTPVTGGGVFLLFIISQILFFLKIFLKVLRYGSITSLMEQNYVYEPLTKMNPVMSDMELNDLSPELKSEANV
jgi:hypothetical protein